MRVGGPAFIHRRYPAMPGRGPDAEERLGSMGLLITAAIKRPIAMVRLRGRFALDRFYQWHRVRAGSPEKGIEPIAYLAFAGLFRAFRESRIAQVTVF